MILDSNQLEVRGLEKWYENHMVFSSVDLTLEDGVTFLYGRNGCGKSTLLSILAGSDSEFDGSIELNKISLRKTHRTYVNKIGYAPDKLNFFPDVSIFEFFNFVISQRKVKNIELVDELCQEFEFKRDSSKKLYTLSLGNAKKLLLITALMIDTDMLLFDEPLNGLDIPGKSAFIKRLKRSSNKIILIASHRSEDYQEIDYVTKNFKDLNSTSKNFV